MMEDNLAGRQAGRQAGKDYSLSLIRLISLAMIITCHMMQYLELELAWWFNVGVQIFLIISGYLYGHKVTIDIRTFYIKRIKRILIPYYCLVIPVLIMYFAFAGDKVTLVNAVKVILLNGTIEGGGHLWFVPTILFCYVITPILESFYKNCNKIGFLITTILGVQIIALFSIGFATYYNAAWLGCYIIGYALGVNTDRSFISTKTVIIVSGILACMNIGQIYIDYVRHIEIIGSVEIIYSAFKAYNHVFLGMFIFLIGKELFERLSFDDKTRSLLNTADKYSYEMYLVHQFVILGPFSLMNLTNVMAFNIVAILAVICVLAWLLKLFDTRIQKQIT